MFEVAKDPDALQRARAALRAAELRVGVRHLEETITQAPNPEAPLTVLLPGGDLPRGAVTGVHGSASLACWILGATQRDEWIAVVGWPELSPIALHEAGVHLERVVATPDAGGQAAGVLAAFLDGCAIVVAGPDLALTAHERRQLAVRARQHDAALVTTEPWDGAALTLAVDDVAWTGPDRGAYQLQQARLAVTRRSKADGPGRRFDVVRAGTSSPTVQDARTSAARRRRTA